MWLKETILIRFKEHTKTGFFNSIFCRDIYDDVNVEIAVESVLIQSFGYHAGVMIILWTINYP